MEQHPVPQNVTTFQFRLIGDMTIKQFGFLAGGAILAYISYKLPLPFFFTWPMTTIFALGGVGFAFVPIEERPMDVWVLSFLKNVYSPTLFVWENSKPAPQKIIPVVQKMTTPQSTPRQATPMVTTHSALPPMPTKTTADVVGNVYSNPQIQLTQRLPPTTQPNPADKRGAFDWLFSFFSPKSSSRPPSTIAMVQQAASIPTPRVVGRHFDISMPPSVVTPPRPPEKIVEDVQKKEEVLQEKMFEIKHELENTSMTETRILELQRQLTEVLAQKDIMETEVAMLRKQVAAGVTATTPRPSIPAVASALTHAATPQTIRQPTPMRSGPTVKIITPEGAIKAGLPRLTTFPNVVTGITKDSDNNMLPGVLVTVKDKEGVPLRALKTNRLGQFAASTPLANGVYFVEIEDPRSRYNFDRVQITLNGSIVPALEIIAKSQRQVMRDQLTKEIFGNTQ